MSKLSFHASHCDTCAMFTFSTLEEITPTIHLIKGEENQDIDTNS